DLSPVFTLLRCAPESGFAADDLVWVKTMAWNLSRNYSLELLRHDLLQAVGKDKLAELTPPYPKNGLNILSAREMALGPDATSTSVPVTRAMLDGSSPSRWFSALTASLAGGNAAARDLLLGGATTEAFGSNNWVVDGTL